MTHDDTRYGATALFASRDLEYGTVIGEGMLPHRAKQFLSSCYGSTRLCPCPAMCI